jgi:hypothetical protein
MAQCDLCLVKQENRQLTSFLILVGGVMKYFVFLVLVSVLLVAQTAFAQEQPLRNDPNGRSSAVAGESAAGAIAGAETMRWAAERAMTRHRRSDGPLCAVIVLPGPADSFDIRLGIFNVAADTLDVLIMDSFRALRGQSLLHQSVFDTVGPFGGNVNVEYPLDESGKGPVVLSFTDFTQFESAAFNTDPDTYDDPDFGATVRDMNGTSIELVYSSDLPSSRRCRGTLRFDPGLNTSIANIVQVFP